ncbi:MAG: DUF2071 domain-containing protein [Flavobacteriaceae bacterium]|nr:DUF2071 domain-containing protein [Flavobacteriaceae bacterium]
MSFLKAEWRKLILVNYVVDPKILEPYIPNDTQLDLWQDKCYVSLVGFMFQNTKLLGVKVPGHVNFEEVNLRFYVKRKVGNEWRRGVVFIKELVPKWALSFVANTVYGESYETVPMSHEWKRSGDVMEISYGWKKDSWDQFLKVTANAHAIPIEFGSEAEFITEHYWGYARQSATKTNEYEVTHPKWDQYAVNDYELAVDFKLNYGDEFEFMNSLKPESVLLAEGSEITVESKKGLR